MEGKVIPFRYIRYQQYQSLSGYLTKFGKIGERLHDEDVTFLLCANGIAKYGATIEGVKNLLTASFDELNIERALNEILSMVETGFFDAASDAEQSGG